MNRQLTDQDVENFEADLEGLAVREQLEAEYFALDDYGQRRMATDPEYARLFRTKLDAAVALQRSANGLAPESGPNEAPREVSKEARAEWQRLYFAVDAKSGRRLVEDPAYRAKCDALRNRIFGIRQRDHNGRVVG
jgi:hypothetical protein